MHNTGKPKDAVAAAGESEFWVLILGKERVSFSLLGLGEGDVRVRRGEILKKVLVLRLGFEEAPVL